MSRMFFPAAALIFLSVPAMAQMRGEGIFERADSNDDGSVTREEFVAARADTAARGSELRRAAPDRVAVPPPVLHWLCKRPHGNIRTETKGRPEAPFVEAGVENDQVACTAINRTRRYC